MPMRPLISQPVPSPADTPWDPSWWPDGGSSLPLELVGYAAAAIGAVALGWLTWVYARWGWQRTAPLRLFIRIGAELRLNRMQLWWLWRVARHQGLSSPITLLLSRATHDHHVHQFVQDRPGFDGQPPAPLAAVREQLFGVTESA